MFCSNVLREFRGLVVGMTRSPAASVAGTVLDLGIKSQVRLLVSQSQTIPYLKPV
jgi:hypothetical protein